MEAHEAINIRVSEADDWWAVRSNMEDFICFGLDIEGCTKAMGHEVNTRWGASFVSGGGFVNLEIHTTKNRHFSMVGGVHRSNHSAAFGKRIM